MINEYVNKKLRLARYRILKNGNYFGEIADIKGVWANASNLEDCRKELQEVLEDWILLKIKNGEEISGFKIKFDRRELVKN